MDSYSYLSNATPEYIESLYRGFKKDPSSVEPEFRKFFEGFDFATFSYNGNGQQVSLDEIKVYRLIDAYRRRGHLIADTNPLKPRKDRVPQLDLGFFGLSENDLNKKFSVGEEIGLKNATLQEILDRLKAIYCQTIGFEFGNVRLKDEIDFLRNRIEKEGKLFQFNIQKKEHIFRLVNKAVALEKFLGTKYIGEKRFSLEGGETTIPALDAIIRYSAKQGVDEVLIGMAHRGRLNVLTNIMGKTYEEIFSEFEGTTAYDLTMGDGDVKYHLGFSHQYPVDDNKQVYVKLMPNPSHLEAVSPVVVGFARAKADVIYHSQYEKILPILIHGDSAVAAQGIVYEVLQMEKLEGFYTAGTFHFVINNQIGFTTNVDDARSTDYCSSVASAFNSPVFHVNGDDIEAVIFVCELAAEFRQKFHKDVWVDMVCYRKWGHNESDDPKYTQPGLYKLIDAHSNPRDVYSKKLMAEGSVQAEMVQRLEKELWDELQQHLDMVKQKPLPYKPQPTELAWDKLRRAKIEDFFESPDTFISEDTAQRLIAGMNKIPEGFTPLRKMKKYLDGRNKLMRDERKLDWAAAELMAYGSLLLDGRDVRLSGEDVKRGTFTHRHAVITDDNNDKEYNRLSQLDEKQGRFFVYNSLLSEFGVLGFEYGYSMPSPESLVLWEAQFGDFANGAQIVIDQFIATAESKWQRSTGMVLLLPHGYEGQGPEHSSARLERYLQLCAEMNLVVVNISEPANFFHALRRQVAWPFRKPLIVMSPKSLLRHPRCISPLEDILKGKFEELIVDKAESKKVRKVLFCTGKIYYDLLERKERDKINDVVIARVEQLYPMPLDKMLAVLAQYPNAEAWWVQEEPENMGAWYFIHARLHDKLGLRGIARKNAASTATGYKKVHQEEQELILKRAFE